MPDSANQPDRILRIRVVLDRTGLTRSTLYRKIEQGHLSRGLRISPRCVGWREPMVALWIRNPIFYSVDDHPDA